MEKLITLARLFGTTKMGEVLIELFERKTALQTRNRLFELKEVIDLLTMSYKFDSFDNGLIYLLLLGYWFSTVLDIFLTG